MVTGQKGWFVMVGDCEELRAALDAEFRDHADTIRLCRHYLTETRILRSALIALATAYESGGISRKDIERAREALDRQILA